MDTPIIEKYYREQDPMKRKKILEKSIAAGEEPEKNAVRKELWEARYSETSDMGAGTRADGFLRMWMNMGFNKNTAGKMFGGKSARKTIVKEIERTRFLEMKKKSPLHEELLYRECIHLVDIYINLCRNDRSYTTYLCGIMKYKEADVIAKLRKDVWETGVKVPEDFKLEEELDLLIKATKEVYELHFAEEEDII